MKVLFILCFYLLVQFAVGKNKQPFYPSELIAGDLTENAHSVIRNRTVVLEVISEEKAIYTVREVITILNQNGDSHAILFLPYNVNIKPEIVTANIYNQYGEFTDKVKNSEIYDQCAFDGFSLYTDARYKRIAPLVSVYPYTVEYEYSMQFNGIIEFPDWLPVESFNQSAEYSNFHIVTPEAFNIRIKESMVSELIKDKSEPYRWEIKNFKAVEFEPNSLPLNKIIPEVKVSPVQFSYDGYPGKMDSWENLGKWTNTLLQGRDELPAERFTFLQNLVKDDVATFDKIQKVYAFLQQKARYVSIQLGIGGYQPFPAATVDEAGYGDCKALTNYMKSMLAAVGINSYYTLVRAGSNTSEIDLDFPSQSFNHAILTVPLENDTIFLECTNSFCPCGFIGDFTADRYALLVSEEGGKLIRTKKYNENINERNSKSEILVLDNGNVEISENVLYRGLQYDLVEDEIRKTKDKQIESEYKTTNISGVKITDVSYIEDRSIIPSAIRMRGLTVDKYAAVMGRRMFLPVNKLNSSTGIPKRKEERKYPFKLTFPFVDRDTVVYRIPAGYKPEHIPPPVEIASDFGKYKSELTINDQEIIYVRYNMKKAGVFPAEKYAEYVDFKKELIKADDEKLILVKTE